MRAKTVRHAIIGWISMRLGYFRAPRPSVLELTISRQLNELNKAGSGGASAHSRPALNEHSTLNLFPSQIITHDLKVDGQMMDKPRRSAAPQSVSAA